MPRHHLARLVPVAAAVLRANHRLIRLVEQVFPDLLASLMHHPKVMQ
jgi:phage tail protein X